jgi:transporter family protein
MKAWFLPASVTFFCWGIWGFIPKITIRYISPMSALVFEAVGVALAGVMGLAIVGFRPGLNPKGIGLAMVTGLVGMVGALGFLFAVKSGKVSVVALFTGMSPVLTIFLAYFLLKEPITLREGLGMACAFMAMVLLAT